MSGVSFFLSLLFVIRYLSESHQDGDRDIYHNPSGHGEEWLHQDRGRPCGSEGSQNHAPRNGSKDGEGEEEGEGGGGILWHKA